MAGLIGIIVTATALCCGPALSAGASSAVTSVARASFPPGGAWAGWSLARQSGARAVTPAVTASVPHGLDVSSHQGNVNWATVKADGAEFAYVKATEGSYYTNPYFAEQYNGAYNEHIIRGAYAFANPSYSSGYVQANYFMSHGGGWSADGWTLPGALDLEYNPYGPECYGLSQSQMVSWIEAFLDELHARTTRWGVIYTTYKWWVTCTGNSGIFAGGDPLWIASFTGTVGPLPLGWPYYTFWQYATKGVFPGDQDLFNGTYARLEVLAKN